MAISLASGVVSHLQQSTEVSGTVNVGAGMIKSIQVLNFRIGGQPVTFRFSESGISNGDFVTAAGHLKKGTLRVLSVRNDTTGAIQSTPSVWLWIFSALWLLLGLVVPNEIVGILIALPGIFLGYLGWRNVRAKQLLASAPRPATA